MKGRLVRWSKLVVVLVAFALSGELEAEDSRLGRYEEVARAIHSSLCTEAPYDEFAGAPGFCREVESSSLGNAEYAKAFIRLAGFDPEKETRGWRYARWRAMRRRRRSDPRLSGEVNYDPASRRYVPLESLARESR